MKKVIALALVFMMVFAMTACGKKPTSDNQPSSNSQEKQTSDVQETKNDQKETQGNNVNVNPVELLFHPATQGSYATIKVDSSVKMDDTSAWLGLCPPGKDYVTELEADDVDVIKFSVDARENDNDPYVWACDFTDVEDGIYALVVATSDDENVGYVAIQLAMEKKGESLTFDYSNAKIKEKPSKNETPAETTKDDTVYEYDYKEGVLITVVDEEGNPKQNDFVIDGIILVGNRHNYFGTDDVDGALASFVKEGYKKEGINSSFYLNEYIGFYVDTKYAGNTGDVKIIAAPHKAVEEYEKMNIGELVEYATENGGFCIDYNNPDEEEYKYVADNYINIDAKEGKYDLIFTYKGKVAYLIVTDVVKKPVEG